jgi:plastocyanin
MGRVNALGTGVNRVERIVDVTRRGVPKELSMRWTGNRGNRVWLAAWLLVFGYAAGCGGSQPADTTGQTPDAGTAPPAGAETPQDLGDSSISGTVTFAGNAPSLQPLTMAADPECASKHSGPVENEMLVLGSGNTMANIMVSVSNGLPAGRTWAAPSTPVVLDQHGCMYVPHVMGIMVGQPYRILNSDGILHNIHTLPNVNRSFNQGMPATLTETTTTFPMAEPVFQIKCDVHPWMSAYIAVFTHPFFSVTGTDGKFTISGLDPGTYEITAWHERLGTQTASVTVGASDTQTQDFTFAVPAAKK